MSLISQLEGRQSLKDTQGGQLIYQQGSNSIFCVDDLWSVNNHWWLFNRQHNASGIPTIPVPKVSGVSSGTVTDGATVYKWGEKLSLTLQNHSHQVCYVTVKYVRPKMKMEAMFTTAAVGAGSSVLCTAADDTITNDGYSPCAWFYDASALKYVHDNRFERYNSNIVRMIHNGIFDHHVPISQSKSGDGLLQLMAANQGILHGTDPGSAALSISEGIGAIQGTADFKRYVDDDVYGTNSCGLALPLGYTANHSPYFRDMFHVYEVKRFALRPEQSHTITLQDKDMKFYRLPINASTTEPNVQVYPFWPYGDPQAFVDPPTYNFENSATNLDPVLFNEFQKFIVLEVHGSLMGADLMTDNPAAVGSGTTNVEQFTYDLTTGASADVVDMRIPGRNCTTHGGILRWLVHKQCELGSLTNETQEKMFMNVDVGQRIPFADEVIASTNRVNHH